MIFFVNQDNKKGNRAYYYQITKPRLPMSQTFTSFPNGFKKALKANEPRLETLSSLMLFARCYNPESASEDRWLNKHPLSGKAI